MILNDVDQKDVSLPLTQGKTTIDCHEYVGHTFFEEGNSDADEGPLFEKGKFVVERVSNNNNYICSRVGGDTEEKFDMSHAITRIWKYEEDN